MSYYLSVVWLVLLGIVAVYLAVRYTDRYVWLGIFGFIGLIAVGAITGAACRAVFQ